MHTHREDKIVRPDIKMSHSLNQILVIYLNFFIKVISLNHPNCLSKKMELLTKQTKDSTFFLPGSRAGAKNGSQ